MFGGWDGQSLLDDTWIFSMRSGWTRVEGKCPPARYRHSAAHFRDSVFIFGGVGNEGIRFNDLWVFDKGWREVTISGKKPSPRTFHSSVCLEDGTMVVFGGRSESTRLNDLWTIGLKVEEITESPAPTSAGDEQILALEKRIRYLESKVICKVCMEKEINCVLIPCQHRCVCLACASIIISRDCICPVCRETILRLVETIDA